MIIDLMSNDVNISKSVDNNTIYALTTALLAKNQILVFLNMELGI